MFDSIEEKDLLEYERLYRIRNEGQSPIDKMNFVTEFKSPDYQEVTHEANAILAGSRHFQTIEIEVFTNAD